MTPFHSRDALGRISGITTEQNSGSSAVIVAYGRALNGEPASVLVQRADSCLYAAKNAGRNRVTSETEMPKAAAA